LADFSPTATPWDEWYQNSSFALKGQISNKKETDGTIIIKIVWEPWD
jgi:hypothetical protein